MTRQPTILVLRALGLGDFMTGLPALGLLRRTCPSYRIVLAAPRELTGLATLSGLVDSLVQAHELDPIENPPERPELAIDLHGNGPESRRLLLATSPRRLLAFGTDGPRWRADEHEVGRWLRLLVEGLPASEVDLPGVRGALPVPPSVRMPSGRTVVHCGAKANARRWPAERFAAVARALAAAGHDVVVTGGAAERRRVEVVAAAAGVDAASHLMLEELCALVAGAALVICGDTGVAHVASNYGTPSVVLFGPVSPRLWGPPTDPCHRVLWKGDGTGDPHADQPDAALLAITVPEVLSAAREVCAVTDRRDGEWSPMVGAGA